MADSRRIMPYETTDMPQPERTVIPLHPAVTDESVRCWRCRRELAKLATRPWLFVCSRCKAHNQSPP